MVLWLFLMVPLVSLQRVIAVFPDIILLFRVKPPYKDRRSKFKYLEHEILDILTKILHFDYVCVSGGGGVHQVVLGQLGRSS